MHIVIHIEAEQMSSCFYFSLNQVAIQLISEREESISIMENESNSGQNLSLYTENVGIILDDFEIQLS